MMMIDLCATTALAVCLSFCLISLYRRAGMYFTAVALLSFFAIFTLIP